MHLRVSRLGMIKLFRRVLALDTRDALDNALAQSIGVNVWAFVILATVKDPLNGGNDEDDTERNNCVIHVVGGDGVVGREDEEHRGE